MKYRDFRFVILFIPQFLALSEAWWYSLNPVVGVIDGFRWCLLGGESQLYCLASW